MKKPPKPGADSAREVNKQATRSALIAAANRRFHRHGFEATTIEEICADADVSRRSFFRYFPNKEALVFPQRAERLQRFFELLRLGVDSGSPVANLRRIARMFAREYSDHRETLLAQQRLIDSSPSLLAREREIDRDWELAIIQALSEHLTGRADADVHARLFAGAAMGIIRATMRYWFEQSGKPDLAQLGEAALDCLQHGFFAGITAASQAPSAPRGEPLPSPQPRPLQPARSAG